MQTALPTSINKKLFIAAQKYTWENEFSIRVMDYDPPDNENVTTVLLTTLDISIDIPSVNLTQCEIDGLEKMKSRIVTDSQMRIKEIEEKIQSLRCIEH
ncbi:hypothetical protein BL250_03140 [Erwinia sp. OLTSP20]|uniref:hypothetical protein n=1 Tax=unclassified Erwinia TaxID=2622719 RepID=UPI000C182614|nr:MULTISPECIES: hypothetical protein [unclassified Erwinia]PIJ51972.1 hypothetical protein BV501_02040 [Erwinia sp. OAMSP11]PIJ74846.1 hypothetical protein BK416_03375 [Erwinia sp. OLSSP12]PIJ78012.1 hypothetical protein BLD47_17465 [Erwinia sp. OLCASP19]PIJ78981.1 hypothetical protein BLD46_17565 [Erwinia sp. OLMTSP26]PIJ88377.1 hypothetical protein BLD49_02565 [Erwinia sp. OLMDSP33]